MTTILIIIGAVALVLIIRAILKRGPKKDKDEMPEGYGEFGLEKTNPIPTSSIVDSYFYLGRLRAQNGSEVTYDRIGSMDSENIKHTIDGYNLFVNGDIITTIYICPNNKKTSTKAPKGFKLI